MGIVIHVFETEAEFIGCNLAIGAIRVHPVICALGQQGQGTVRALNPYGKLGAAGRIFPLMRPGKTDAVQAPVRQLPCAGFMPRLVPFEFSPANVDAFLKAVPHREATLFLFVIQPFHIMAHGPVVFKSYFHGVHTQLGGNAVHDHRKGQDRRKHLAARGDRVPLVHPYTLALPPEIFNPGIIMQMQDGAENRPDGINMIKNGLHRSYRAVVLKTHLNLIGPLIHRAAKKILPAGEDIFHRPASPLSHQGGTIEGA